MVANAIRREDCGNVECVAKERKLKLRERKGTKGNNTKSYLLGLHRTGLHGQRILQYVAKQRMTGYSAH